MKTGRHRISGAGTPVASRGLRSRRHRNERYFRIVAYVLTVAAAAIIILHTVNPGSRLLKLRPAGPPPINNVDPVSGKPVDGFSPTATYENYTIGFCCDVSKSRWVRLPKEDKDAFILRFVPHPETGK
jgi:hypothetical protein